MKGWGVEHKRQGTVSRTVPSRLYTICISLLPQVESVTAHGYEVLYLTEDVDEFALQMLRTYSDKEFSNVCQDNLDLDTDEEKERIKSENEKAKELCALIKESVGGNLHSVRFTASLQNHPVCLSSEGALSVNMEKILNKTPGMGETSLKAELVLEININHPIAEKLKELFESDKEKLASYSKVLYTQARLVGGLSVEDPAEFGELICNLMLQ